MNTNRYWIVVSTYNNVSVILITYYNTYNILFNIQFLNFGLSFIDSTRYSRYTY